jgi:hypothetical protein
MNMNDPDVLTSAILGFGIAVLFFLGWWLSGDDFKGWLKRFWR